MKFVFSLLILFTAAGSALAQEKPPKVEVFGGYSYLRISGDSSPDFHGWNASVNYNFNNFLGVKADIGGHYNSTTYYDPFTGGGKIDLSDFTYMFGPQFSYRKNKRVVPFAHVLLGGVRTKVTGLPVNLGIRPGLPVNLGIQPLSITASDTSFGASFGGGLDLKLTKGLALRLFQADYLVSRSYDAPRLATGLVIRF
jgi:opacity protein-like surface antigen